MIRPCLLLLPLLSAACKPEWGWPGGTGVGNPGSTHASTRRQSSPFLEQGTATLRGLQVLRCSGDPVEPDLVGREIDLLGDGPFPVAGGRWCALEVQFDGPLVYSGVNEDDPGKGTFTLTLDVGSFVIPVDEARIDEDDLVLELGHRGWLDKDIIGPLEDGTHTEVAPGDPAHDPLVSAIREGSAILWDLDGDGEVSDDERDDPVAAGSLWDDEEDDDSEEEDE